MKANAKPAYTDLMKRPLCASVLGLLIAQSPSVHAEPTCRGVEVRFTPQGMPPKNGREELRPQIAVWIEKNDGSFLTDLFVTRSIGMLGLGNRPGNQWLKSDFRWPYGRRPQSLPVWAYRRGKTYPFISMGGKCSPTCPPDFQGSPSDDDNTVAYHGPVSSTENYYCSPSGWRTQKMNGVDVVSCASAFYGSKGYYAAGKTSVYPPRADLSTVGGNDSPDVKRFAMDNDVAAISGATPANGKLIDPIRWFADAQIPDDDYVLYVEVGIEGDFNAYWPTGRAMAEPHAEWDHLGKDPYGQPSIVYKVPFRLDKSGRISTTKDYAGYGDFKGENGKLNPPDSTISQSGGSGADRLAMNTDDNGTWRVKVSVSPCDPGMCDMPSPPTKLALSEVTDTTFRLGFAVPAGAPASEYRVRYQSTGPITAENFARALPAPSANLGPPGAMVGSQIVGLLPKTKYYIAVQPVSRCGAPGTIVTTEVDTSSANFTTLTGCFIATAAFGSELEPEVNVLRQVRDKYLVKSPLGLGLIGSYYTISPGVARLVAEHPPLRNLVRETLKPVVRVLHLTTGL
ncbi:MAG TPA: fibronectin type III domain-containing protein [Pseudomonadota bacterium]|nr:fibronectin type III domain-containing protein [Pseudomonadota bacterium]HNN52390.1 fibronectin type III domain-containing protein [Pseudomonadota bacterium]